MTGKKGLVIRGWRRVMCSGGVAASKRGLVIGGLGRVMCSSGVAAGKRGLVIGGWCWVMCSGGIALLNGLALLYGKRILVASLCAYECYDLMSH